MYMYKIRSTPMSSVVPRVAMRFGVRYGVVIEWEDDWPIEGPIAILCRAEGARAPLSDATR
jgi:hypothetical protein